MDVLFMTICGSSWALMLSLSVFLAFSCIKEMKSVYLQADNY